ncbi:MAG: NAD(P)H-dependent oxidoreductase [Candidatus Accumulibacter sp.]|jgi:glutathione-regulated potassium-efflux system ancillary protein KefF|nr:NAD(P)H-dependent oxidoreductase [Accumulibacter sp.]
MSTQGKPVPTPNPVPLETAEKSGAVDPGRRRLLEAGIAAGVVVPAQALIGATNVLAQSGTAGAYSDGKAATLVIASHPYPDRSVVNKALWNTVENSQGIVFRRLESLYGDDIHGIDVETERKAYEGMDRVVFMFPIHWFNLTPMLKAYFNEVWTQWAPQALKGKKMLVVTTVGAKASAYTREGRIGFTIEEVLAPMKASANYAGMIYLEPLAFLGVSEADEKMIRACQDRLAERLRETSDKH